MASASSSSPSSSWVPYPADTHFPIQNLPYGVFRRRGQAGDAHVGVAIGDQVLDLHVLAEAGLFADAAHLQGGACFKSGALNEFMGLGKAAWDEARALLTQWLSADCAVIRDNAALRAEALVAQSAVQMELPARIGDYTDFYSSRYHATNVGIMFRGPENALKPNWVHLPVGYHGRASSVRVSGADTVRPCGQLRPDPDAPPTFGPCRLLDFELEMGVFVGPGNPLGRPIKISEAKDHIFGYCVLNDWSARDVQKWEYIPLGPFNGKNFSTTISPWVVTAAALEPFMVEAEKQEPKVLPYLDEQDRKVADITLEVAIQPEGGEPTVVSRSNAKYLYWTPQQQLVHHSSTGCNMNPGDLLGSGTISGPEEHEYGSMLELCWKGTKEVPLSDGSTRKFLKDGDTVHMTGYCEGNGYRVGFGPCSSKVLPALQEE